MHSRMASLFKTLAQGEHKEHAGAILIATAIGNGLSEIAKQVAYATERAEARGFARPK